MTQVRSPLELKPEAFSAVKDLIDDLQGVFTFIVGTQRYDCPRFVAALASPRIADLLRGDRTIDEYVVETADQRLQFSDFLKNARGASVVIKKTEFDFFLKLALELQNLKLYTRLEDYFEGPLSTSNVFARYHRRREYKFPADSEISFLAANFEELAESILDKLTVAEIYEILQHPGLRLTNESHLVAYLWPHIEENPEYFQLFECIHLENLPSDEWRRFGEWTNDHFDHVNPQIWEGIYRRLNGRVDAESQGIMEIPFNALDPTNGILSYCSRNNKGSGLGLNVPGSSFSRAGFGGRNNVPVANGQPFHSRDAPNQGARFDFNDFRDVIVRSYRISSKNYPLRSWVLESSLDGLNWQEIDRRENVEWSRPIHHFEIHNPIPSCSIRLRHLAVDHRGYNVLSPSCLEFYGRVEGVM
jgi:hypothetical protein